MPMLVNPKLSSMIQYQRPDTLGRFDTGGIIGSKLHALRMQNVRFGSNLKIIMCQS